MLNIKKKSQIIVLLILTIAVGIKTNFFRNLAEVALYKFDDRIINKYGYCSGESIGYLLYLKKKYQIKDNPKIVKGIYPGGQSGFPGSRYYDNMINDWVKGELYDLEFSSNKDNIKGHKISLLKKIYDH